jgi:hypothetical protein
MPQTLTWEEAQPKAKKTISWEEAQPDHGPEIDAQLSKPDRSIGDLLTRQERATQVGRELDADNTGLTTAIGQNIPGIARTTAEHAAVGLAPGAAFSAAAPAGARAGAIVGAAIPVLGETGISEAAGAIIGGLISGGAADWVAYKAQHGILEAAAPEFTKEMDRRLAQGAEEHPIAAIAGDVLGNMASMKADVPKLAQIPFRAALGASTAIVPPLIQGKMPDAKDVAEGALMGTVLGESRFGGDVAPVAEKPAKPKAPSKPLTPYEQKKAAAKKEFEDAKAKAKAEFEARRRGQRPAPSPSKPSAPLILPPPTFQGEQSSTDAPIGQPAPITPRVDPELALPVGQKLPKPVVPETPPEPERALTAVEEIRQRGLKTKAQIQDFYEKATGVRPSNQKAQSLRNDAWGPPTSPAIVVPPEVKALLPKTAAAVESIKAPPAMKRQEAENVFGVDIPQGSMSVTPDKIEAALKTAAELNPEGAPNASRVTSPASVSQPEVRPQVGQKAPLRQQGKAPAARPPQGEGKAPSQAGKLAPPVEAPKSHQAGAAVFGSGPIKDAYSNQHSITIAMNRPDMTGISETDIRGSVPDSLRGKITGVERFKGSMIPSESGAIQGPAKVKITFSDKDNAQKAFDYFKSGKPVDQLPAPVEAAKEPSKPARPLNPEGQKTSDGERIAAEKAAAGQRAKEAADIAAKQQPGLPGASASAKVDTIAGKMDLTEFEKKGYSPEQVTKQNWIDLQRSERRRLGQPEGGDSKNAPNSEYEEYHKNAVKQALGKGESVDSEVLADYPDLKQQGSLPGTQAQSEQQAKLGTATENPMPAPPPSSQVGPSRRAIEGMKHNARISEVVPPQQGVDPSQASKRGQELIDAGADPEQIMAGVQKTGKISPDDMAVIRRHQENLAKASDATAEAYAEGREGPDSESLEANALAAREAEKAWTQRIQKFAAPSWARTGQTMQGALDINTDSWVGLQRAYGKEFTPKQLEEAKAHAEANKAAQERIAALEKQLADLTAPKPGEKPGEAAPKGSDDAGIKKVFADYEPGKPMTDLQAKTLWNYLRSKYADKFGLQLHKIAGEIATDLGLTHDDVLKGLGKPAGVKKLADEILVAARERRRLKADAENWVENQKTPGWQRFVKSIPQAAFNMAIFGHGGTWIGTHTPAHVFNPADWAQLFPTWFRSLKTYYKTAIANDRGLYHEQMVQRLVTDQLYPTARAAGLKVDPIDRSEAYQNKKMDSFLGRFGLAGNEAFDGLKFFRFAKFKGEWNALPESLKTKDMAKALADGINTSTGASNVQMPKALSTAAFAPRLEYSRWKLLFGDTARTAKTFGDWKNATPEEKQAATRDFRQKATIVGTYFGLLALNQGVLQATGSPQSVNFTDSKRGDWLNFKVGGLNVGVGTPFLHIFGLLRNLAHDAFGKPKGRLDSRDSREKNIGGDLITYGRQKLSPIGQRVADVVSQKDIMGNVVPWSDDALKKYELREGKHKLGVGEYLSESLPPIPLSQAAREIWKDQGMTNSQADRVWRAIITAAAAGATGARVGQPLPYYNAPAEK